MKRIISVLLIFSLLFGCAPVAAFGTENDLQQDTAINTGDVSIEGTNTMGKLLSEAIEDDMDEPGEQMTGYSIQDLTFNGNTAFVTYSSLEAATLVVAIYTEDGMQLLGSAKTMVSADETQVTVTLEMDMPTYFYASAYLLDTYDMSPLCTAFDTPMYTREMQELLESTVEDYDQDRIVQLDDSNSTNFVVYNESIRVVEYKEGVNTVASINEESYTYVIENADSDFTTLQIGDIVAYSYDADNILIVKVASISTNGTTVTLTGEDMDIEEVFSHVKIENDVDTQGLTVDESVADEGVSYDKSPATRNEGSGSTSASKKFNINMHYFSIKVEGSIGLQVDISFSYYISLSKRYVDFKVDTQVGYEISVGGEVSIDVIKLPSLGFAPVPGLFIGLEPVLQVEFSGAMKWSASASFVLAASYVSGKGLRNHSSTPKVVNNTTEFSGTVFVGIDLKPHVAVVTADLLSLEISLPVGIEMEAVQRGTDYEAYSKNPEKIHGCESCLDISVDFVGKAVIELTLLKLTFDIELVEIPVHLFDCYYSITHSEFGFGKCPYASYRVSIHVKTTGDQPVANVEISADDQVIGTTNKKGVLSVYLPEDMYDFSAKINDDKITESKLVNEACKVLLSNDPDYLKQKSDAMKGMVTEDAIKDLTPVASGKCGTDMRWVLYKSGELRLTGSGNMQSYAQNDFPWIEYYNQIKSVYVNEGITGISSNAFKDYTSIEKLILPNSITSIGSSAFKRCTGLTEIRLPVDYAVHTRSFMGCSNVKSIHYTPGATGKMQDRSSSDTSENWYADTLEYSSSQTLQQVYFEEGITHIASYAFHGCVELTTVTFPSSLETLGRNAFYGCRKLQGIDFPKTLQRIDAECFYGCSSITNAMLPEGLSSLGERAFYQCSALENVSIPSTLTLIPDHCFYQCVSISKLTIPDSITTIKYNAFRECTGLTEIRLPVDYTVHTRPFMGCSNVKSIHYTPGATGKMQDRTSSDTSENWYVDTLEYSSCQTLQQVYFEDGITHIASYAFYGCAELTTVTFPSSLETLGRNAFYGCRKLQGIDLPKTLQRIDAECFYGCSSITNAMLPEGLTTLGERAFYQCSALENVSIPSTLNTIYDQCFYRCISISSLTIPDSITTIRYNAFGECTGLTEIRLPVDYAVHTRSFMGCSNVKSIHYTPGATGKMQDRTSSDTSENWYADTLEYSSCQTLQQVYFEDGITHIANYAFYGCTELTTAMLPGSLESLGRNAFYCCSKLQGIDLPETLLKIGAECFYDCSSITTAILPEGLTSLGERAFYQCSALENVSIPSTLNTIYDQCFYRCISISSLTIPDSITAIRYNAFGECTGLTEIRLPVDYTVHTRPFMGCSNVKSIHYTPGATGKMQDRASSSTSEHYFGYTLEGSSCQTLQQVYFEEGILSISSHAFYGCNNATFTFAGDAPSFTPANYCNAFKDTTATVYYPAGNSTWTDSVFQNYGGTLTWVPYGSGGSGSYSATGIVYQIKRFETPALHAIYSGEYGTVIEQEQTVKTASFSGLVPGEQYVMLALLDANARDLLATDNLIAIDQAQALEDGTLVFRYIQREHADTAYVIACGASNKNLKDATITFPYMATDGTTNVVDPTVIYEQNTLREGLDYVVVGTTDYEGVGTYTCYVRGINNYTGLVECAYTVSDQIAAVYVGTTQQSTHASFAEAVQAAGNEKNAYVKLLWDIREETTVSGQVYVDLNGKDLSGITVTGTLCGMDSSTDEYTDDEAGSLACTVAQSGRVLAQHVTSEPQYGSVKRYVAVPNENGYSFHRLYLGITHQTVKPATDGVGYKAIFAADDTLKAYLSNYGYSLQLGDNDAITASKDGSKLVSLDPVTLRIDNYDVASYGETDLRATVFVTLADGTVIESAEQTTTLRSLVENINDAASSFTSDQLSALKAMIEKHEAMQSWNVSNIIA